MAEFAEAEHGAVAHPELLALGLSPAAIQRWARSRRLHRLYPGVYAVGHPLLTERGRLMAAVKACGQGAVLSHQSAASLHDLRRSSSPILHVTTAGGSRPSGIRVHRARRLHAEDCAVVERIPVTSVARTSLDLAEVLPLRQVIRVLEQAERVGVFDLNAIHAVLARNPGRHGARALKQALAEITGEPPHTNSDWERDLLDFCDDFDIPRPELNVIVECFVVDALWRAAKVIVELDSWAHHRSRTAFEEDRRRIATLQLAGYLVLPITWRRFETEPEDVARQLRQRVAV